MNPRPRAKEGFLRRLTAARGFTSEPTPAAAADEPSAAARPADVAVDADNADDDMEDASATAPEFVLSAAAVDSLEALAVLEAVRDELGSNHLVFYLASLKMVL